jgi:copper(I)-binding protein
MRRPISTLCFTLATFVAAHAYAQGAASTAPVAVENAWARATATAAKTGAVYLTIVDHGAPDRLIAAATPLAATAQIHQTTMQNNVMRMRPVDGVDITAQGPVTFAPGGYHIMLLGLKHKLAKGQSFPLSLTFQHAGTIEVAVAVEAVGAGGPVQDAGPGHDMDKSMPMPMPMPASPSK